MATRCKLNKVSVSQDELTEIEGKDTPKCKYCGKSIWYETIRYNKKQDGTFTKSPINGTTYRTIKVLNDTEYPICVCQKCLEQKYPDFKDKNKSKIFNTFNKYVEYAFEIPEELINEKNKLSVPTLENCIRKHGEKKGKEVYEEYRRKQAYSNSFEYKQEKYGWTKEQFDSYNKSRSVTLEHLITRHGEEDGNRIWNEYCKKQSYTTTNEYMIETFGEDESRTISLLKAGKLEGFIRRYGEIDGNEKYKEYINHISFKPELPNRYHQSDRGLIFFKKLIERLNDKGYNFTFYYGDNEMKKYSHIDEVLYSMDFYIPEINMDIEFNGDYWHANPDIYGEDWFHPVKKQYAKDIWLRDKKRCESLQNEFDVVIINIWEKDIYKDNKEDYIIEEILKRIENVSADKKNK